MGAVPQDDEEYAVSAVPLSHRKDPVSMALLWLTMVTQFPSVLIGFAWFKEGFTFNQVLLGTFLSCGLLMAYTVPAAFLGAMSGQTYAVLSRTVFGSWGSRIISTNLIWIFVGWYTVLALCLADELADLLPIKIPLAISAAILSFVMAFNNFFGFSGVANFARFVAAPLLLIWVGISFCKALPSDPSVFLAANASQSHWHAFCSISSFVVGFSVWGNEPDYWRYAKPKLSHSFWPLLASLFLGVVLFPVSGWMFAHSSGITESAAATAFLTKYSMGGFTLLAVAIISAAYFAANDSNMYGSINALENLRKIPQRKTVFIISAFSAALAYFLAGSGATAALEGICSLNCVILPLPTVVMVCEWFWQTKILKEKAFFSIIPSFESLPAVRWPALWAALAGMSVGILSSGIIPGTAALKIGIPSVQSWLVAMLLFFLLRPREAKQDFAERQYTKAEPVLNELQSADTPQS
ncbi:MAG: cytosine permease [Candidatus Obscuribacterales bacterium]|nr:cytosine permease [Candidatus Obscuribacterales bacterium]